METELIDKKLMYEINEARKASQIARQHEPRALSVYYNPASQELELELKNGSKLSIDTNLIQGLENATPNQRSDIQIEGEGYGLHWETLDVDISVPGLVKGIYGTKAWMTHLGQKGGQVKSEAKSEAARANGKKGGRPSKQKKQFYPPDEVTHNAVKLVEVELPENLVHAAEALAKQQGISPNELYQKAMEKYIKKQPATRINTHQV
jgi:Protein of unknown function (DUF2442)